MRRDGDVARIVAGATMLAAMIITAIAIVVAVGIGLMMVVTRAHAGEESQLRYPQRWQKQLSTFQNFPPYKECGHNQCLYGRMAGNTVVGVIVQDDGDIVDHVRCSFTRTLSCVSFDTGNVTVSGHVLARLADDDAGKEERWTRDGLK